MRPERGRRTFRLEERMGVYNIPLITQRENYVKCAGCGDSRLTRLPLEKLAGYPPEELDRHLYRRVSIVTKVMALASVLVFCIPFVSLGFGVGGLVGSYRTGGWVKVVSIIGITIGVIVSAFTIFMMLNAPRSVIWNDGDIVFWSRMDRAIV